MCRKFHCLKFTQRVQRSTGGMSRCHYESEPHMLMDNILYQVGDADLDSEPARIMGWI